jgi:hypothetical protein
MIKDKFAALRMRAANSAGNAPSAVYGSWRYSAHNAATEGRFYE